MEGGVNVWRRDCAWYGHDIQVVSKGGIKGAGREGKARERLEGSVEARSSRQLKSQWIH